MRDYEAEKQGTKRRIVEAFWELYKTTNIEKITVKNIADACGIYRTTFYLHFTDVYAILEKIETDLMEDLKRNSLDDIQSEEEREEMVRAIYTSFRTNAEYLHVLLDGRRNPQFAVMYKRELIHQICIINRVQVDQRNSETGIIIERTLSSMIDLFLNLSEAEKIPFDRLLVLVDGFMQNGIIATLSELDHICAK